MGVADLTPSQQRAHFALWALLKSPLLLGADLRSMAPSTLALFKAKELLAVNQDPLGVAGELVWKQASGRRAVAALPSFPLAALCAIRPGVDAAGRRGPLAWPGGVARWLGDCCSKLPA